MHQTIPASNFIKPTLLVIKGQIVPDTKIMAEFNIPLSSTGYPDK
jgi:hypothetical protein